MIRARNIYPMSALAYELEVNDGGLAPGSPGDFSNGKNLWGAEKFDIYAMDATAATSGAAGGAGPNFQLFLFDHDDENDDFTDPAVGNQVYDFGTWDIAGSLDEYRIRWDNLLSSVSVDSRWDNNKPPGVPNQPLLTINGRRSANGHWFVPVKVVFDTITATSWSSASFTVLIWGNLFFPEDF